MIFNDDFMNYMGYRNMVVEDKVEECMAAIRRGETNITVERGDLTDGELNALQRELQRRLNR